ncbi:MAG: hypothetical protein H7099_05770 [Gemmatimonadaceae bacterium]|nr:hypothetical protein [Gemmatimonadaceae bacterium]
MMAMSIWGRSDEIARAMEAGFSSVLLKPALRDEIIASLSGVWSKHSRQRLDRPDDRANGSIGRRAPLA